MFSREIGVKAETMFIPRNPKLEAPTKEAVLASGLLTQKASVVYAYRGSEPMHDLQRAPQGVLVYLTDGLAFLATTEHPVPINALVQHLPAYIASTVGRPGGVLRAVLAGANDLTHPESALREALDQCLADPDTFVIPYAEIIETVHVSIGKFGIGRRDYTVITRESARGERESFCLTPADDETADALLMLRFAAEKRAVRVKLLHEATDFHGIQLSVLQKFRAQFPSTLGDHRHEIAAEIMEHAAAQLGVKGSSLEHLDAMVLDELAYFRTVPQFEKYFTFAQQPLV